MDEIGTYCLICATKQIHDLPVQDNIEVQELKLLLSNITLLDPCYTISGSLEVNSNQATFCDGCKNQIRLLKNTFDEVVELQHKLNCLSTVILYGILKSNSRSSGGGSTVDNRGCNATVEWNAQFHEWNLSRLETLSSGQQLDSDKLLKDGLRLFPENSLRRSALDINTEIDNILWADCEKEVDFDDNFVEIENNLEPTTAQETSNHFQSCSFPLTTLTSYPAQNTIENWNSVMTTYNVTVDHNHYSKSGSTGNKLELDHDKSSSYACKTCPKTYRHERSLIAHEGKYHKHETKKPNLLTCPICNKCVSSKRTLLSHLYNHEKDVKGAYPCKICHQVFGTPDLLLAHINTHDGEFKCSIVGCKKLFKTLIQLESHLDIHSSTPNVFGCNFCDTTFESQSDCDEHVPLKHGHLYELKEFLCQHCGKSFRTKTLLSNHLKVHGHLNFHCDHCNRAFRTAAHMKVHRMIHTNEKPHRCRECSSTFRLKSSLKAHLNVHSRKPLYQCEYCPDDQIEAGFSRRLRYLKHLATKHPTIYIQPSQFVCNICWDKFETKEQYDRHLPNHEKLKCKVCNKQFQARGQYTEHILRHGLIRPFKCPHCDKTFFRKSETVNHMVKSHPQEPNNNILAQRVFVEVE